MLTSEWMAMEKEGPATARASTQISVIQKASDTDNRHQRNIKETDFNTDCFQHTYAIILPAELPRPSLGGPGGGLCSAQLLDA